MKVTVVGTGNAGCAHSFKIARAGHEVRMLEPFPGIYRENFKAIHENGGIWAEEAGERTFQEISFITSDPAQAIEGCDAVMVVTQSLQHERLSSILKPLIGEVKLLIVSPGYMGSLFFKGPGTGNVIFAEGESMPYDARLKENGVVQILFKNSRNALSFHPVERQDEGLEIAGKLVDTYRFKRRHVIESAMHNPNLIVHTIGAIMSAARIEYSKGEFWMYREAFTPSIWNLVERLDGEKMDILEKAGCRRTSYLETCRFRTEENLEKDPMEVFRSYADKGSPKGPGEVNHRYIYEDVPMGLCLMGSLGRKFGVKTPVCDSLVEIASALLKKDFRKESRTLETLGMGGVPAPDMVSLVES